MTDGKELSLRALLLGVALTAVFTAANVFLGLRVGLTFATSIPAAVISMAVLRVTGGGTIRENNIVQTVASAAGTLGSIIFVLPGLVIVGWWGGFPFWQAAGVCAAGGVLGVVASVPLRRALVTGSDLPFPEGTAAAAVLETGSGDGDASRAGLAAILFGSVVSAGYAALAATRIAADEAAWWVRLRGGAATGIDAGFSFALLGVGHLVGLSVGTALLAGMVLGFGIATPVLGLLHPIAGEAGDAAMGIWSGRVRFLGAGVIGVAALWTLARLVAPIARGLAGAVAASRARTAGAALPVEERDMPVAIVAAIAAALAVPVAVLLHHFAAAGALAGAAWPLAIGGTLFVAVAGVLLSAVCGYMAGLIGSSNSPLSGIGILAVIAGAGLLALAMPGGAGTQRALVAFTLFAVSIVFAAAAIANDNLQDLKTGQLVGATPWKQQAALIVGVLAGAATVPPVLDLLGRAYGFGPATAAHPDPLPAPQAVLLSDLARGMLGGGLDWGLIAVGGAIGAALIAIDAALGRAGRLRLPPLAVGIGIYLPMSATLAVVAGAVAGHLWRRRHPAGEEVGVLLASGLVVGESLFGVVAAGLIAATGDPAPLAIVGPGFRPWAMLVAVLTFPLLAAVSYRRMGALAAQVARKG